MGSLDSEMGSLGSEMGSVGGYKSSVRGAEILDLERVSVDSERRLVIFSGGTAFNSCARLMREESLLKVSYVLPVSDDGGSTSEIIKCLGGPAVGDIRSRCVQLSDDTDTETLAVREILGHRLSSDSQQTAEDEWHSVLDGSHKLWTAVAKPYRETILAFLEHFRFQLRDKQFDFRNGSVGNFFLSGARCFFKSLEAATLILSRVLKMDEGVRVLPAISTEKRVSLVAELENGTLLHGQNLISHPGGKTEESKLQTLPSKIRRIFYNGAERYPEPNPAVVDSLVSSDSIIYSMGSLFTSIAPTLALRGVGDIISEKAVSKILILNATLDRETRWSYGEMKASDVVLAISEVLTEAMVCQKRAYSPQDFVTTMIVPEGGEIEVDFDRLAQLGITDIVPVPTILEGERVLYNEEHLVECLRELTKI
ncbi:hypothetical protein NDN08_003291 [Rhodosorus marinus]|uniref:Gluconeogenesis factor n=1 Tax=Rhodosorus marinus TaxID=101924 RepID=A0AAV8UWK9_9RHOD|nr:hypothetical protein NDN08_003291 [Rhodosorus marinus]